MPERIDFGSFEIMFLRSRHDTGGALDMFELTLRPEGRMPVPHYHDAWEETVYGVRGTVTYTIEGVPHDIAPGETVFVPRKTMHGFLNRSGADATCLCVLTPGVIGPEYFRELAALVREGRPAPEAVSEVMTRYGLLTR